MGTWTRNKWQTEVVVSFEIRSGRLEPSTSSRENKPWSACYAPAVKENDFWQRELATPALLYMTRNKREAKTADGGSPQGRQEIYGERQVRSGLRRRLHPQEERARDLSPLQSRQMRIRKGTAQLRQVSVFLPQSSLRNMLNSAACFDSICLEVD